LLDRFPAFRDRWRSYQEVWEGDDSPRTYLDAAQFSDFVIERFECRDNATVSSAFNYLESLLTYTPSNSDLAGLIIVGILEGIYLQMSSNTCESNPYEQYMGPATIAGWKYLETTWAGKKSLAEVIRAETRSDEG
jgi:hypothetical protein